MQMACWQSRFPDDEELMDIDGWTVAAARPPSKDVAYLYDPQLPPDVPQVLYWAPEEDWEDEEDPLLLNTPPQEDSTQDEAFATALRQLEQHEAQLEDQWRREEFKDCTYCRMGIRSVQHWKDSEGCNVVTCGRGSCFDLAKADGLTQPRSWPHTH